METPHGSLSVYGPPLFLEKSLCFKVLYRPFVHIDRLVNLYVRYSCMIVKNEEINIFYITFTKKIYELHLDYFNSERKVT